MKTISLEMDRFKNRLLEALFKVEDIESNQIENIIFKYYKEFPYEVGICLQEIVSEYEEGNRHNIFSNIIYLLGRLELCNEFFQIAVYGLWDDNVEVRKASILAFEKWGDKFSKRLLANHKDSESDPQLRDYIDKVLSK